MKLTHRPFVFPSIILTVLAVGFVACRASNARTTERQVLKAVVDDKAERSTLLELINARDADQDDYAAARAELADRLRVSFANYDVAPAELSEILSEFDVTWEGYRNSVITSTLKMREHTTAEEWRKLAPATLKTILALPAVPLTN